MSKHISCLIEELSKLPGIGEKTASRLAIFIMQQSPAQVKALAMAIVNARTQTKYCKQCFNYSDTDLCSICANPKRDQSILCVVEEYKDILAVEASRDYLGLYAVLGGVINPMSGISPDMLHIKELLERIRVSWDTQDPVEEVIIALDGSVEAAATTMYITKVLKACSVKVSRISFGISVGASLEFVDPMSISAAIAGRVLL